MSIGRAFVRARHSSKNGRTVRRVVDKYARFNGANRLEFGESDPLGILVQASVCVPLSGGIRREYDCHTGYCIRGANRNRWLVCFGGFSRRKLSACIGKLSRILGYSVAAHGEKNHVGPAMFYVVGQSDKVIEQIHAMMDDFGKFSFELAPV